MNFNKKELNIIQHFVYKNKIESKVELLKKSPLSTEKTNEIIRYLEKKMNSNNFEIIFSMFNKRLNSKKTKSLKTKRNIIENKYNDMLSKCW